MTGGGGGAKSKSPFQIFGNVFISFIGAGVLGLPYAFKEAGFLEGIIVMTMVAILSTKAMLMLIDCKDRVVHKVQYGVPMHEIWPRDHIDMQSLGEVRGEGSIPSSGGVSASDSDFGVELKAPSKHTSYYESFHHLREKDLEYSDVAHYLLGYTGKLLVEVSLVVSQTGFCCAYLIFIQENLTYYAPSVKQGMWLVVLLPLLACLCFYRQLNSLSVFSLMADFANLFAYLIVFYFDFSQHHTVSKHPKAMTITGLPFFLGIALYCFEGAGMILSLEASVDPTVRHLFRRIFKAVMIIVTSLYVTFGAAGYLSFGRETEPIITLNLPHTLFPHMVKACLCFSLFFTYPMMMFPVVQLLESKFLYDSSSLSSTSSASTGVAFSSVSSAYLPGNVLRCCLVGATGVVVIAIPNFSVLMALVGSLCCTLLAFILPAIFHLTLFENEMSHGQLMLNYFLIFIGVLGALLGTWDALCRLFPSLSLFGMYATAKSTLLSFVH